MLRYLLRYLRMLCYLSMLSAFLVRCYTVCRTEEGCSAKRTPFAVQFVPGTRVLAFDSAGYACTRNARNSTPKYTRTSFASSFSRYCKSKPITTLSVQFVPGLSFFAFDLALYLPTCYALSSTAVLYGATCYAVSGTAVLYAYAPAMPSSVLRYSTVLYCATAGRCDGRGRTTGGRYLLGRAATKGRARY